MDWPNRSNAPARLQLVVLVDQRHRSSGVPARTFFTPATRLLLLGLAAIALAPGAQAWAVNNVIRSEGPWESVIEAQGGPIEDLIVSIIEDLCVPDVHADTNPPFIAPDLSCLENPPGGTPADQNATEPSGSPAEEDAAAAPQDESSPDASSNGDNQTQLESDEPSSETETSSSAPPESGSENSSGGP